MKSRMVSRMSSTERDSRKQVLAVQRCHQGPGESVDQVRGHGVTTVLDLDDPGLARASSCPDGATALVATNSETGEAYAYDMDDLRDSSSRITGLGQHGGERPYEVLKGVANSGDHPGGARTPAATPGGRDAVASPAGRRGS